MRTAVPQQTLDTCTAEGLLTIDLDALRQNYRTLADRVPGAKTAAVVKANAYGIGLEQAADALLKEGVDTFFVAQLGEGIRLRKYLNKVSQNIDIYIFNGVRAGQESLFADHDLIPVLNSLDQVDIWSADGKANASNRAALHVDTGMNRLGFSATDVETLATDPSRLDGIETVLVMSHLACADTPGHELNKIQLQRFQNARKKLPDAPASLANSAGVFLGPDYHFDLTRPGIALYGGNPTPHLPNPVSPVVSLEVPIIQVRDVPAGQPIGYSATYTSDRDSRIAILPLGYADGLLRALSNHGILRIAGKNAPLVGRVSMDLIAVDVTDIPDSDLQGLSHIQVFGEKPDLNDLADAAKTISYELLTLLGPRYKRVYRG